jgi:hypothetical protein
MKEKDCPICFIETKVYKHINGGNMSAILINEWKMGMRILRRTLNVIGHFYMR